MSVAPAPTVETVAREAAPRCSARALFAAFFAELEQRGIASVVLHGYDDFPDHIESDVDYAVADADLPKIAPLLAALARKHGWVLAQNIEHQLFASYCLVIDPEDPASHLALDVCSHFAKDGCLLLRDATLLDGRGRHRRGFHVPSPASEFIYRLAKTLAKHEPVADVLPRLQELWALDPSGAQRRFDELFGNGAGRLEAWFDATPEAWARLARRMRARTRFGLALRAADVRRRIRRALRPSGLHIALLGPDGAGKSTLIERLRSSLAPCFGGKQRVFKFRPDVFGRNEPGDNPAPHHRPPRSPFVSWLKILYYFADWWLGWLVFLLPERRRGALVVFDRDFEDIVVDQRRYLVQSVETLARVLRRLIPRPHITFLLDANAQLIHARKPELPVEVLERQRSAYRQLAERSRDIRVICAERPAAEVTRAAASEIVRLLAVREQRRGLSRGKRSLDIVVSLVALPLLAPVLVALAVLVACRLGTPILFRQRRPGLLGQPFTIYKFRTMTDARQASGRLLPDAQRLTPFGKFLRSTSLDELPELFNVLRGDMSLVGPRPLLMEYLPLYSTEQMRRHDVLPGITGWAQINGRNAADWQQKFACDVWYVDHRSLLLDLKIIALTFRAVLKREGINQPGHATGARFRGSGGATTETPRS